MSMELRSVYAAPNAALYLYALLAERPAEANISHRKMPTAAQHLAFMESRPYLAWYLICEGNTVLGATYLSKAREIGIFIFREHQRHGWAERALRELMTRHPGKFLANVAPGNEPSKSLFGSKLGGKLLMQTYEL